MTMKRLLGPALLAARAARRLRRLDLGQRERARIPAVLASTTASDKPTEALAPQTIAIVSQTAAGGEVDLNAVPVDDDAALQEFTAQFNKAGLEEKIATAVAGATVPEGYTVMGAVVAIGCDVPPDVSVEQGPDGWVVRPHKVPSPLQECFAPVTSVAIVAVPA